MKKIAVLYSSYTPTIDAIKFNLDGIAEVDCLCEINENEADKYDLIVLCGYNDIFNKKAINIHHSLLPSFSGENPVKEAVLYGAKVTGLTVYYTNPQKIIAQYPVFITDDAHYDDIVQELNYLEQVIYPVIINKILKNESFEINSIIRSNKTNKCLSGCGGCSGCSK